MGDTISRLRTPNSATLPGGSRKNGNLSAHGLNPEKHSPGVLEEELQASLQDDVTRQLGHKVGLIKLASLPRDSQLESAWISLCAVPFSHGTARPLAPPHFGFLDRIYPVSRLPCGR